MVLICGTIIWGCVVVWKKPFKMKRKELKKTLKIHDKKRLRLVFF